MVAATVVPPISPFARAIPKSRKLTLRGSLAIAKRSSSNSSKPTRTFPSMMAIVAGVAPRSRTMASIALASSRL